MKSISFISSALFLLCLTGCGEKNKPESSNQPIAVAEPDAATLSGKAVFTGQKPSTATIDMSATPACTASHKTPQHSDEVVVNGNGTLRYVFVWVKSGIPDRRWPVPSKPVVLDQTGCMYEPHVVGAMVNQEVKFANSDPTNHNVHPLPRTNTEWNESELAHSSGIVKHFSREEVMMPVKCNIHPWMRAWIGVVNHPFFSVTGDDGSFRIKGLPPGKYTLEAWHERYGKKDIEIEVAAKEEKIVDFEFKPGT